MKILESALLLTAAGAGASVIMNPSFALDQFTPPWLFSICVDDAGVLLPAMAVDPHYRLTASADPLAPGPYALVLYDSSPVTAYVASGPDSKWISPGVKGLSSAAGPCVYRTSFELRHLKPTMAWIDGEWAIDNEGFDIALNGTSLGLRRTGECFRAFASFVITNGFADGASALDFVTNNLAPPGPPGFRIRMRSGARPLPSGFIFIAR
jgi:hypothetical protein